MRHSHRIYL